MKINLINPPSPFLMDDKVHPPLGLMYIAAYLIRGGSGDVTITDLSGGDFEKKLDAIPEADIYGISATTPQYGYAKRIRGFLAKNRPLGTTVLGGPHAMYGGDFAADGWDKVVSTEGERAMLSLANGGNHACWKNVDDLDTLPYPARHLMDLKSYKYYIGGRAATTLITSRSCPYSCSFCSKAPGHVRVRSAEDVIGELDEIRGIHGFNAVMFYDDIFVTNYARLQKITSHMKRNDTVYRCFARANLVNEKTFELLGKTGCVEVGFGAESGSDTILKGVRKMTTVRQNTELVRMAHKHGVRVKAFLIAGLPGETEDTLDATERWITESGVDDFDITVLTPYPGSDIYEHPEKYDIQFDKSGVNFDKLFYKGKMGEYSAIVSTKALTSERIVERRDEIERRCKH